jgi:insulysin
LKSLCQSKDLKKDKEESEQLRQDLFKFYHSHYSASRMALCVQVAFKDPKKFELLKEWVSESFSMIKPNEEHRLQNFAEQIKPGFTELPKDICPFDNEEMVLMNTIQDESSMMLVYCFPHNRDARFISKSYNLVLELLGHEGKGSLLNLLKSRKLAETICVETVPSYRSILDMLNFEITLTAQGLQQYQ